ncbi:MAG: arginase [Bryobacteraceae bacterium]|nr:arginase [Bryobacteraceae bacterium]
MHPTGRASKISIIGAPMDLGAGRRGVDMGVSAIRVANLRAQLRSLGYDVEDLGNIPVEQAETQPEGQANAKYLPQIQATVNALARKVEDTLGRNSFPIVLGGDHSVAIGTVSGVSSHFRKTGRNIGVIWIDAHADMNTPQSSPSGNIHGMPLACLIGVGPDELTKIGGHSPKVDPRNVAIIGLRRVDEGERTHVRRSGVHAFTMRDIDELGMRAVMEKAVEIASAGTDAIHLSLDMDSVDPSQAPGVGTPVPGGITYREAHLAMEILCDCSRLASLEVVEVNPILDDANRTAILAVELILSALGKRIL